MSSAFFVREFYAEFTRIFRAFPSLLGKCWEKRHVLQEALRFCRLDMIFAVPYTVFSYCKARWRMDSQSLPSQLRSIIQKKTLQAAISKNYQELDTDARTH